MSAYLIKHPNNNNKFICNICSDVIEENKIIGLKCNLKKHIFCYDCIYDWYLVTKKNYNSNINSNYNFIRMCPICRKNGGYLPNLNNNYTKDIHCKTSKDIVQTCGYKLKGKDDYCMNTGKKCYNNLCKKHYNIELKKNNKKCQIINRNEENKQDNDNDELEKITSMLNKNNIFLNIDNNCTINIIK